MTTDTETPIAIERLLEELARKEAFPHPVGRVEVRQTHISAVFLADDEVYKVKKPVDLGFLDFSTLEKRRHFCAEEVRLNRRLAPGDVYRGVVPIVRGADGALRFGAETEAGAAVEWAVRMRRLPDAATLLARLQAGDLRAGTLRTLAGRLAAFHAGAARDAHIAHFGTWGVVERNAAENFAQSTPLVGTTISRPVHDRLAALTEAELRRHRRLIQARAERGVPCETHGDLHLDHVYAFPEREPPHDLVVLDCIEFNERFRHADPVADVAFLAMDLLFHRRAELAETLVASWVRATGDEEGRALFPFYVSYRAAVRGKVEGFALGEREIDEEQHRADLTRARAHWLLALTALESPGRRPGLVLVGGLPGTGKSTLARALAARSGFRVIRSDLVRKELAGIAPTDPATAAFGEGIYIPKWSELTYAECLRRAEAALFEGERVVVDATFACRHQREPFARAARRLGVPGALLVTTADAGAVRRRLAAREGDASDADWAIYCEVARRWETPTDRPGQPTHTIPTRSGPERAAERAVAFLRAQGLHGEGQGRAS